MPFLYKKKVFDAAVTSAMLYSCESWVTNKVKGLERQYNGLVKCLLGVRKNTSVKLCMIESGIPPVTEVVKKRRCNFFLKAKIECMDMEQPFRVVYEFCRQENTPGYRFFNKEISSRSDRDTLENIKILIRQKPNTATKIVTYRTDFNPPLTVHQVYMASEFIPDYQRESFTRLRLMSHNLRIETGGWSRTPSEQRVCLCDGIQVQTERHVLVVCPLTAHLRDRYPMLRFTDVNELLNENDHIREVCKCVFEVLSIFT